MRVMIFVCLLLWCGQTSFSQAPSTRGEVFDFELGDEFHYEEFYPSAGVFIERIRFIREKTMAAG